MYKNFRISEDEKKQILEMHKQAIKESFDKDLGEQVPPKTPNTQAPTDDSKRREIYNSDLAKWKTYFNFRDRDLIEAKDAIESVQIPNVNGYMMTNFKSVATVMEKAVPQDWQRASASSYKTFGNYTGIKPGSAWPTIINYVIDLKINTLALIQQKSGMPVTPPKNPAPYQAALKNLGIQA